MRPHSMLTAVSRLLVYQNRYNATIIVYSKYYFFVESCFNIQNFRD